MRAAWWTAPILTLALVACGGERTGQSPDDAPPPATTEASTPPPAVTEAPVTPPAASGGESTGTATPAVNSLTVDPADGTVMIGTGPALYRLKPGAKKAEEVSGQLSAPEGQATVSGNLVVDYAAPNELLASGHPEGESTLPENLGLIRSRDQGATWEFVAGLVDADYHEVEIADELIVAVEAESPDLQVSRDGGRSWESRTPPATPIDIVVDPDDPQRWAVSTEEGTFVSNDAGGSWRPREPSQGARLAWTSADALYSVDRRGAVKVSSDGGRSWRDRGELDGLPSILAAGRKGELYAAVVGGKVLRSRDRGATWPTVATLG